MSNNPLKQYFRTPSLYFKLPSGGKHYGAEVVEVPENDELAVYPMTNLDEIAIRTPDALFNGDAVVRVIKNCVPAIKNPWELNNIDVEAVIIAIRAASIEGDYEMESDCPSCNEDGKYGINLTALLMEKKDIDYSKRLTVGPLEIKFRPLTYAEINRNSIKQFEVQRIIATLDSVEGEEQKKKMLEDGINKMNDLTNDIVTQCIDYIKTPETMVNDKQFIKEFLVNCDSKSLKAIREYSAQLREQNDTKPISIKCVNCGHDYKQPLQLNFTDFFA